jgi:hypothetical protein
LRQRSGSLSIRVRYAHKFHVPDLILELPIDARVVAAKRAAAYDPNPQFPVSRHSKNRNLRICHRAATPSRQVIFFPSS